MVAAFISYSSRNQTLANQVADALREANLPPWIANEQTNAGETLGDHLKQKIAESACVVLVLTPQANTSKYVGLEVSHALQLGKRIVPISFRNTKPQTNLKILKDLVRIDAGASFTQAAKAELLRDVRAIYRSTAPVVTMLNLKGGVGKTTLAANLFGCMHEKYGKSVLLIDFDPQHNLTQLLVPDKVQMECWGSDRSILSIFESSRLQGFRSGPGDDLRNFSFKSEVPTPDNLVLHMKPDRTGYPRFDLVPGHFAAIKYTLPGAYEQREELKGRLQRFLRAAQRVFDIVAIDVNPGSTALTEMAVQESTHILAPFRPDRYSAQGLRLMDRLMKDVYRPEHPPKVTAILNGDDRKSPYDWPPNDIGTGDFPIGFLSARIGHSTLMNTLGATGQAGDFTGGLAYRNTSGNAKLIRGEIERAALEYMDSVLEGS